MKFIFLPLFIFLFFASFVFAQIQITEIMYNPDGNDDNREWIEAVNFNAPVNVKTGRDGWKLNDGKNHYLQTADFVWNANEVIVFAQDKIKFLNEHSGASYKIIESSFYLKNSGGEIKIFDENKNLIAETNYSDMADDGYSLIFNNGWQKGTKGGSPGVYPNSVSIEAKSEPKSESEPKPVELTQISAQSAVMAPQPEIKVDSQVKNTEQKAEITPVTQAIQPTQQLQITQKNEPIQLFLNEFLPNTKGKDEAEFLELINPKKATIKLDDFSLKVGDKKIKLTGETNEKFIVLWQKDYKFSIRNKGETIILLFKDKEIHKINYSGSALQDKSFARIENSWFWTKPTPGRENLLVKNIEQEQNNSLNGEIGESQNNQESEEVAKSSLANVRETTENKALFKAQFMPVIVGFLLAIVLATAVIFILK